MRFFGHDVKVALKTKLDADFNTMIDTIRTERADSTIPYVNNFTFTELTYNYPEGTIVFHDKTELQKEILSDNILIEPELYPVRITITIMTNINLVDYYMDYYIEALERVLHGANISGFTWIRAENTEQNYFIDESTQTYRSGYVDFEVRIN